jgi:purine-binding chemotaxis protein CheW
MMNITTIQQSPDFIKGVINLRLRFQMGAVGHAERTCIIVVELTTGKGKVQMGIVVDTVSEVLNVRRKDIEDTPPLGTRVKTDFILAMAKAEDRVKLLLDIDKIVNGDDMANLSRAA